MSLLQAGSSRLDPYLSLGQIETVTIIVNQNFEPFDFGHVTLHPDRVPPHSRQAELAVVVRSPSNLHGLSLDLSRFHPVHLVVANQDFSKYRCLPKHGVLAPLQRGTWTSLETIKLEALIYVDNEDLDEFLEDLPPSLRSVHVILRKDLGVSPHTSSSHVSWPTSRAPSRLAVHDLLPCAPGSPFRSS